MRTLKESLLTSVSTAEDIKKAMPAFLKAQIRDLVNVVGLKVRVNKDGRYILSADQIIVNDEESLIRIKDIAEWSYIKYLEIKEIKNARSLEEIGLPKTCDYLTIGGGNPNWKSLVGLPVVKINLLIKGYWGKTIDAPITGFGIILSNCTRLKYFDNFPDKITKLVMDNVGDKIRDLSGLPKYITDYLSILHCDIMTCNNGPKEVGEKIDLVGCDNLENIDGIKDACQEINIRHCRKLNK